MKIFLQLVLLLIVSAVVTGQPLPQNGLIVYYPFNNNTNDESGNQLDGIPSNVIFIKDRFGNPGSAIYMNGKNSGILLPRSTLLNFKEQGAFTLSVWLQPDPGNSWPAQAILVKSPAHYDFTQSIWTYGIYLLNYKAMTGYAYNHLLESKNIVLSNKCWFNIIITYNKGLWNMYLNGKAEANSLYNPDFILNDKDARLAIGKKGASSGDWYKGKIDEVSIYNRVLSPDEIRLLASNPCATADCSQKIQGSIIYSINDCNQFRLRFSSSNNQAIKNIKWLFGDNQSSTILKPSHIYTKPGTYTITAIITCKNGCRDSFSRKITIQPFRTGFNYTEEGDPGMIQFKAVSNNAYYTWNFGDGDTVNGEAQATHTYRTSGQFSVRMTARNNSGCMDTAKKLIRIQLPAQENSASTTSDISPVIITELPESIPLPVAISMREKELTGTVTVKHDTILVLLYDNGIIDGDTVSLVYDDKLIAVKKGLHSTPFTVKLTVPKDNNSHELLMFADNLGAIPPNTAMMLVIDGEQRHKIYLSSNQKQNAVVRFVRY